MKLRLIACAQSHAVDQKSNNVSLFNLIEELEPQGFPAVTPPFTFFVNVERSDRGEESAKMRLVVSLGGDVLSDGPFIVGFQGNPRARGFAEIAGIVLSKPGVLAFTLFNGTEKLGEWPILVKPAAATQIEVAPPAKKAVPVAPKRVIFVKKKPPRKVLLKKKG